MAQPEIIQPIQQPQPHFPDIQAEKERITSEAPLLITERDKEFYNWLADQRDSKVCGIVLSPHRSGISESCQYYRLQHSKYRGTVLLIPVPVIYIRVPSGCTPTQLFSEFHEALRRRKAGSLGDWRKRIRATLKEFGVKLIIIDDAQHLKLKALRELVQIHELLKIPVILIGTEHLYETLRSDWKQVHNSFLSLYEFPAMSLNQTGSVVDKWLNEFLQWPEESDLVYEDVLKKLYEKSAGLTGPLYDALQKMAIRALNKGLCKIDEQIVDEVLNGQFRAVIREGSGDEANA